MSWRLYWKRGEIYTIGGDGYLPVFVKLAPDFDNQDLIQVLEALKRTQADGVILTNTTLESRGTEKQFSGGIWWSVWGTIDDKSRALFESLRLMLLRRHCPLFQLVE